MAGLSEADARAYSLGFMAEYLSPRRLEQLAGSCGLTPMGVYSSGAAAVRPAAALVAGEGGAAAHEDAAQPRDKAQKVGGGELSGSVLLRACIPPAAAVEAWCLWWSHMWLNPLQNPPTKYQVMDPKEVTRRKMEEGRAEAKAARLAKQAEGTRKISSFFAAPAAKKK